MQAPDETTIPLDDLPEISEDALTQEELQDNTLLPDEFEGQDSWIDIEWYDMRDIHAIKELRTVFSTYTHQVIKREFRHMRSRKQPALTAGRPYVRWYIDKTGMTRVMANMEVDRGSATDLAPVMPPVRLSDMARRLMEYPGTYCFQGKRFLTSEQLIDKLLKSGSREEQRIYLEPDFDPI